MSETTAKGFWAGFWAFLTALIQQPLMQLLVIIAVLLTAGWATGLDEIGDFLTRIIDGIKGAFG